MNLYSPRIAKRGKRGFTLVELLVVIGIIALLLGILMPSLNKVRQISRRVVCKAQLHDIGLALKMYLDNNRNFMPSRDARFMPYSVTDLSQTLPFPGKNPILRYLGPYLNISASELAQIDSKKVYCKALSCPADSYNGTTQFFFKSQTSSYEYDPSDRVSGQMIDKKAFRSGIKASDLAAMSDFEAFHGKKPASAMDISDASMIAAQSTDTIGSYNYLFCDIHVGDRKGF
jgi:prepilin-type N-terminal cleavage/methylation domain-containing protein